MWVRKRIEITTFEMLRGMLRCISPGRRTSIVESVQRLSGDDDALICLSVRSGFDQLLKAVDWPSGSEIIVSGLTIPDMPRIIRHHKYKPVSVDVGLESLAPDIEQIKESITPDTRAILIAHLFGGLCEIEPIIELAHEHGLLVIEDCAQAFVGRHFVGSRQADVSMFSFGPIKTNTALGGALLHVRSKKLRDRLEYLNAQLPRQGRFTFFTRLVKYAFVRLISTRFVAGSVYRALSLVGRNHDGIATNMARGFAGPKFFEKIRRQPSTPLLGILDEKLKRFDRSSIQRRTQRGLALLESVGRHCEPPGSEMSRPTFWVMPLLVNDPAGLVESLWKAGFDATTHSSLIAVGTKREFEHYSEHDVTASEQAKSSEKLKNANYILNQIVYVPFDSRMPQSELDRLAETIVKSGAKRPTNRPIETADMDFVAHVESRSP